MATNNNGGNGEATSRMRKSNEGNPMSIPFLMQLLNNQDLPPHNQVSTDLRLGIDGHSDGLFSYSRKPFTSYTSLPMDTDPDEDSHSALVKQHTQNVNAVINTQAEIMRCTLEGLWQRQHTALIKTVEEREEKKLKEKEMVIKQLQEKVAHHSKEERWWQGRAEKMERSLRAAMQKLQASGEGTSGEASRRKSAVVEGAVLEEDAASSHVDPGKVQPVMLDCKLCRSRVATVMVWPCRHVCMCITCDPQVKICMVCHSPKDKSMEVRLFGEI